MVVEDEIKHIKHDEILIEDDVIRFKLKVELYAEDYKIKNILNKF